MPQVDRRTRVTLNFRTVSTLNKIASNKGLKLQNGQLDLGAAIDHLHDLALEAALHDEGLPANWPTREELTRIRQKRKARETVGKPYIPPSDAVDANDAGNETPLS